MTIAIRPTEPHEFRLAADAFSIALMNAPPDDDRWEKSLPSWQDAPSFSAWDGDACVGHASHDIVDTTVPGGARLSTSAVTRVGVLPTHRRKGIGSGLMTALIDDAVERNLTLMSLRASEATIYDRYGFGVAGDFCAVDIDPGRVRPLRGATTHGTFRILAPGEITDVVAPLYDRVAHRRPGVVTRPLPWTNRLFRPAVDRTEAAFVAVHLDGDGAPDGYVFYTVQWDEGPTAITAGVGELHELFGASDEVELALWQYLFDTDLVGRWTAKWRPLDDLARFAARDQRGYRLTACEDEQWVRLIDADAALAGRTYHRVEGAVVIRVDDPVIAANNGAWRIDAEGAVRTDDSPDLTVGIETISAAYLGGPSWAVLAGAGAVGVTSREAITIADTLFASRPLPFSGTFF